MAFNWLDYLQLATVLAESSPTSNLEEARYRTAISRAYYAAYHFGRQKAEGEDASLGGPESHREVIKYFQAPGRGQYPQSEQRRRIGNELKRLRDMRNRADYHANLNGTPANQATIALTTARQIIKVIDEL